jgi:pimeloyl-ACP methyl ester carboxylesterase
MNGVWSTVEIGGKTADVYDPPGNRPRFGVLHLHGYGLETLPGDTAFTRWFDEFNMACVCPHGQRSWWADRICHEFDPVITPERYLLDAVAPYFGQRWNLPSQALALQGISMGGQGALRLAFKHPQRFAVVAGISPAIEYHEWYYRGTPLDEMYDSKEQCRQDTVPMHIHPSNQPPHLFYCIDPTDADWYRGCDRLHEKLNALGVTHELDLETSAGGHSWDYFRHMAQRVERFVFVGLEQQSRRLL